MKLIAALFFLSACVVNADQVIDRSFNQIPAGATDLVPRGNDLLNEDLNGPARKRTTTTTVTRSEALTDFVPTSEQSTAIKSPALKLTLEQIRYAQPAVKSPEYVLILGGMAYRSVEELKKGISRLPTGTQITWAPSCDSVGEEPLRATGVLSGLTSHCKENGIVFVVIPSG